MDGNRLRGFLLFVLAVMWCQIGLAQGFLGQQADKFKLSTDPGDLGGLFDKLKNLPSDAQTRTNLVLQASEKVAMDIGKKEKEWYQDGIAGMQRLQHVRYHIPGFPEGSKAAIPDPDAAPIFQFRCMFEKRSLDLNVGDSDNVYAHDKWHGGKNQRWRVRHAPLTDYPEAVEITSLENGEALDMRTDGNYNIYTHSAHNGSNQRFLLLPKSGNLVFIVSCRNLDRVLTTESAGKRNVAMHPNAGEPNQLWLMIPRN